MKSNDRSFWRSGTASPWKETAGEAELLQDDIAKQPQEPRWLGTAAQVAPELICVDRQWPLHRSSAARGDQLAADEPNRHAVGNRMPIGGQDRSTGDLAAHRLGVLNPQPPNRTTPPGERTLQFPLDRLLQTPIKITGTTYSIDFVDRCVCCNLVLQTLGIRSKVSDPSDWRTLGTRLRNSSQETGHFGPSSNR